MPYKNKIRTYPIKSLTIFVAVCFTVSVAMIILFAFLTKEEMLIRVLIFIFCGLFAVASGIILVYQLFFYVAADDEYFYRYFLFGFQKIKLQDIERIINQEGFYFIIKKGRRVASFAGNTKEGQQLIVFLERKGVKIDW